MPYLVIPDFSYKERDCRNSPSYSEHEKRITRFPVQRFNIISTKHITFRQKLANTIFLF